MDWLPPLILFASPIWITLIGMEFGPMRTGWKQYLLVAVGAFAPGAGLFLATRQADAITSAAAYYVCPALIFFWGMPLAGATFSIRKQCGLRR